MKRVLTESAIDQVTTKLAHFLADAFLTHVKTLNFHWNMRGKEFFMFHKLLQQQYEEFAEILDELAERIRALGRLAPGSMAEMLKLTCMKESPSDLSQEMMIQGLVHDHDELVEHCHALISFADSISDHGTSDLMNKLIRFHANQAWLLRSHLVNES